MRMLKPIVTAGVCLGMLCVSAHAELLGQRPTTRRHPRILFVNLPEEGEAANRDADEASYEADEASASEAFLTPEAPAANPQPPQPTGGDILKVIGRGAGETDEEALKDAFRDAVESAVGVFCDSETKVHNFELVRDEILTQSNGFITKYETISKRTTALGREIQIDAWVRVQAVTRRIKELAPGSTASAEGLGNIFAEEETKQLRDKQACRLLKRELEAIDPAKQLFNIRLAKGTKNPVVLKREGSDAILRFTYEIYPMTDVYFKVFVPRITQLLGQISIKKPRKVIPTAKRQRTDKYFFNEDGTPREIDGGGLAQETTYNIKVGETKKAYGDLLKNRYGSRDDAGNNEGPAITVVTKMNPSMTAITATDYFLAPPVADLYAKWNDAYLTDDHNHDKTVTYVLSLLDAEGEPLLLCPFEVPKWKICNGASMIYRKGSYNTRSRVCESFAQRLEWIPLLPYPAGGGYGATYATTYRSTVDVRVPLELWPKAKSMTLRLMDAEEE